MSLCRTHALIATDSYLNTFCVMKELSKERWSYRKVEEWTDTVVAVSRVSRMAAVGSRSSETEDDLLLSDMGARRKDTE